MLVLAGALFVAAGCGVANNAIDSAIDRAAQRTGEAVGDAVGQRVGEIAASMVMARFPEAWDTRWMSLYVNYLFTIGFNSGSYAVVDAVYEPGDWTRWRMMDGSEATGAFVERAYLEQTDSGEQWWRLKYISSEDDEAIVLEGLFTAGRDSLLRLRAQFPGEEPKELPVQEGTYTYVEPVQLTDESLDAATVGTGSVTVPAGSFDARHIRYGTMAATLEWWITDDVPGNLVKYARVLDDGSASGESESAAGESGDGTGDSSPQTWTVELVDYGEGAERELVG